MTDATGIAHIHRALPVWSASKIPVAVMNTIANDNGTNTFQPNDIKRS